MNLQVHQIASISAKIILHWKNWNEIWVAEFIEKCFISKSIAINCCCSLHQCPIKKNNSQFIKLSKTYCWKCDCSNLVYFGFYLVVVKYISVKEKLDKYITKLSDNRLFFGRAQLFKGVKNMYTLLYDQVYQEDLASRTSLKMTCHHKRTQALYVKKSAKHLLNSSYFGFNHCISIITERLWTFMKLQVP